LLIYLITEQPTFVYLPIPVHVSLEKTGGNLPVVATLPKQEKVAAAVPILSLQGKNIYRKVEQLLIKKILFFIADETRSARVTEEEEAAISTILSLSGIKE
jgi:hypothetical protein